MPWNWLRRTTRITRILGALYFERGQFSESLPYQLKAVELGPRESGTHFALAMDYQNLGRYDEAEKELRLSDRSEGDCAGAPHSRLRADVPGPRPGCHPVFSARDRAQSGPVHLVDVSRDRLETLGQPGGGAHARAAAVWNWPRPMMARDPRSGYTRSFLAYLCTRARIRLSRRGGDRAGSAAFAARCGRRHYGGLDVRSFGQTAGGAESGGRPVSAKAWPG